jgi:hypothetical protein
MIAAIAMMILDYGCDHGAQGEQEGDLVGLTSTVLSKQQQH